MELKFRSRSKSSIPNLTLRLTPKSHLQKTEHMHYNWGMKYSLRLSQNTASSVPQKGHWVRSEKNSGAKWSQNHSKRPTGNYDHHIKMTLTIPALAFSQSNAPLPVAEEPVLNSVEGPILSEGEGASPLTNHHRFGLPIPGTLDCAFCSQPGEPPK